MEHFSGWNCLCLCLLVYLNMQKESLKILDEKCEVIIYTYEKSLNVVMIFFDNQKNYHHFLRHRFHFLACTRLGPLAQGALSPCLGPENQQGFYWSQMVDGVSDSEVRVGKYKHV